MIGIRSSKIKENAFGIKSGLVTELKAVKAISLVSKALEVWMYSMTDSNCSRVNVGEAMTLDKMKSLKDGSASPLLNKVSNLALPLAIISSIPKEEPAFNKSILKLLVKKSEEASFSKKLKDGLLMILLKNSFKPNWISGD
ncbi:hypothetical protein WICPIJ_008122 [Wickerhamomyces pijperi]|uniref:Uncharacterized protein n=1 Tax=Wickerhamomyces pijperi TaxID=599730 RepID=A0A9P8Q011_WICPI|nr:hypothetical protein WICPIJ_008122 [Wickerhamomyces pijperi]